MLVLECTNIKSHLMQSTLLVHRFFFFFFISSADWYTLNKWKCKRRRRRRRKKEKILNTHTHREWTILENEIIYVLICFEQSAQILGQTKRRGAYSSMTLKRKLATTTSKRPATRCGSICMCLCLRVKCGLVCVCVLWHGVFTWRQIINEKIRLSPSLNRFWAILLMPSNLINWCSFASLFCVRYSKDAFPTHLNGENVHFA